MSGLPTVEELAALVQARADERAGARLEAAIAIGRELGETGDALIERFVGDARAAGLSWTEIGRSFGTSKQAAQKRFGDARGVQTAREVLEQAAQQARSYGHNYVGTEHALLVLLSAPDDLACQVLGQLGITHGAVAAQFTPGIDPRPFENVCVMPRFKRALEHGRRIAQALGTPVPRSEHLLAGIVAVPDAVAVEILFSLGATPDDVRAALAARLGVDAGQLLPPPRRRRRLLAKAG